MLTKTNYRKRLAEMQSGALDRDKWFYSITLGYIMTDRLQFLKKKKLLKVWGYDLAFVENKDYTPRSVMAYASGRRNKLVKDRPTKTEEEKYQAELDDF